MAKWFYNIKNRTGNEISTLKLKGKIAPKWELKNLYGKTVKLSNYKGEKLLIEFTGLGCGPCYLAIPFLNKFNNKYKDKGFHVISIETFSNDINALKGEKKRNKISFEFLIGDNQTVNEY